MYERSLCVGGFETEVIVFIVCREKKKKSSTADGGFYDWSWRGDDVYGV